jgi:hypothetical protein
MKDRFQIVVMKYHSVINGVGFIYYSQGRSPRVYKCGTFREDELLHINGPDAIQFLHRRDHLRVQVMPTEANCKTDPLGFRAQGSSS